MCNSAMAVPIVKKALHLSWRWTRWRGLTFLAVFLMGLAAFHLGADVSQRPGVPDTDLMTKVYYTLGLFVLGGLDLGVPTGEPVGRVMLWLVYFLAPALTTSAVVESLLRVLRPRSWRLRRIRDHLVVVGCGRLGMLYLERLREHNRQQPVLVVEAVADHANAPAAWDRYRADVLFGDITNSAVLDSLRLEHARRVVLLTGDDFVNLDTAARICRMAPHLAHRVVLHVADIRLMHVVEQSEALNECVTFNSFQNAARHLVQEKLLPHFLRTEATDTVILAGFGRFGQTVLDELQNQAADKFAMVIIVDQEAVPQTMVFADQVGFRDDYQRAVLGGDIRDPRTWQEIEPLICKACKELVVVLASDDANVNVQTAMWLSSKFPAAYIVARCFYHSTFTEQISQRCNFEIVSAAELLRTSMEPEWFLAESS